MRKIILLTIILTILIFSGCGKKTGSTGILTLQITDAPPDLNIQKVDVTISEVKVHKGDLSQAENDSNETSSSGWATIVQEEKTFDLIQIKDVKEFLGTAELETGKYTQIRLKVIKAIAVIEGEEMELKIPSNNIKLTKGFTIEANQTLTLTLDFDAKDSIHQTGPKHLKNNTYIMRPTIKIIQE